LEAQQNYAQVNISSSRFKDIGRPPNGDEPVEKSFRAIDLVVDNFEPTGAEEAPWPDDRTVLYWWRTTYWRPAKP
jgi:hypothetical protein